MRTKKKRCSAPPRGFGHPVGREHYHATGLAMLICRDQSRAQIFLAGHVHNGVVDQHAIEHSAEAQHAHITLNMFDLGVLLFALRQHHARNIGQREREVLFEESGDVAATAAQLEHSLGVLSLESFPKKAASSA